jgi:hypothetical protein
VTALDGRFAGWPANNGAWGFDGGREVLVGFTDGPWVQTEGHNTEEPYTSHLSRSVGGGGWTNETPPNFVGRCATPVPPPGGIDFSAPGFALRAVGTGYHGNDHPGGSFFYTVDRGHSWLGPFSFGDLNDHPELAGMELCAKPSPLPPPTHPTPTPTHPHTLHHHHPSRRRRICVALIDRPS